MDIIDIMYEIKYNETNFTAIKELIETNVSNYLFEILCLLFVFYILIKQNINEANIKYMLNNELNLLTTKFENRFLLMENDFDKFISSFSKTCNELVEDSETNEKRFCKNSPKKENGYCYLHDEETLDYSSSDDLTAEGRCIELIKDPETKKKRFCKNYIKKDSDYCNTHSKKYIECNENYVYESESEEL